MAPARERVFVGIGSNIEPLAHVRQALKLLAGEVALVGLSTLYYSEPLGAARGTPRFVNAVVEIAPVLSPRELKFGVLRPIEARLGRVRHADKCAPRTVDLDLLLYGERIEQSAELCLPDPEIARRPFVALPLFELAPQIVLPGSGQSLCEIVRQMNASTLLALAGYTRELRRELKLPL